MTASEYLAQGDGAWIQIKCGVCGKSSDANHWTQTEIGGDLPPGEYQCPKCRAAFKRVHHGEPMRLINGQWSYSPVECVAIPTRL